MLLDEVLSKEPLGPVVPLGDDQWFDVVKWVVFATIEAEELGITAANVASMVGGENPVVRRLLGDEGDLGPMLALSNDWVVKVIGSVGNYGEIYDRNLGPEHPLRHRARSERAVDRRRACCTRRRTADPRDAGRDARASRPTLTPRPRPFPLMRDHAAPGARHAPVA